MRAHAALAPLLLLACALPAPAAQESQAVLIEERIRAGRELLDLDRAVEAEQLFLEAEVLSGKAPAVRKWIWRAWMQENRVSDALEATEEAALKGGMSAADLAYLRGMGTFYRGRERVAQAIGEPLTSIAFREAADWLEQATTADGEQYEDAWLALAECAWQIHDVERGLLATAAASKRRPSDPRGELLRARLLYQRYQSLSESVATRTAAAGAFAEMRAALEQALAIVGTSEGARERAWATDAWLQLGYAELARGQRGEAVQSLATAIAKWPGGADFDDLWARLSPEEFSTMMEGAASAAAPRFAPESSEDAALWWWLGSARYRLGRWTACAEAYERARAKWPAYEEAAYWAARAHARAEEPARAVEQLVALWSRAPELVLERLRADGSEARAFLDGLIEWCARAGRESELALLQTMRAEAGLQ